MTRTEALAMQDELFPCVTWHRKSGDISWGWGHRPTLPEICMDLRMALNGVADPWSDEDIRKTREMLVARLKTWVTFPSTSRVSGMHSMNMDDAVRSMVLSAIGLIDAYFAEKAKGET